MKYTLINPLIKGKFDSTLKAGTDLEAAQKFWDNMSSYFSNNLSKFPYSLMDGGGKMSHFVCSEKKNGSNVEYSIKRLKDGVKDEDEALLKTAQKGGKRKKHRKNKDDSSSSSSSSSDDDYLYKRSMSNIYPIMSWDYYPLVYTDVIDVVSIPSWVNPVAPAMNLRGLNTRGSVVVL